MSCSFHNPTRPGHLVGSVAYVESQASLQSLCNRIGSDSCSTVHSVKEHSCFQSLLPPKHSSLYRIFVRIRKKNSPLDRCPPWLGDGDEGWLSALCRAQPVRLCIATLSIPQDFAVSHGVRRGIELLTERMLGQGPVLEVIYSDLLS